MNARTALLLTASACLLLTPLAQAGSQANPNATDPNDDVEVNGGANCGLPQVNCIFGTSNDFTFPNADIHAFWANDTAELLLLTVEMKAGSSFQPGFADPFGQAGGAGAPLPPGTFDWVFSFNVSSTAYTASAHMAEDGTITCGGVAILCPVHDANQMSFAIPWAAIGSPAQGAAISGLVFTAHGEDGNGNTLDERAPDVATAADYLVANATAAAGNATGNATGNGTGNATGHTTASASHSSSSSTRASFSGSGSETAFKVNVPTPTSTSGASKGSPGFGLTAVAAGLVGAALMARRRLR